MTGLSETIVEEETRRRCRLTMAAYCYEVLDNSKMSDAEFDAECLKVDLSINTHRPDLDAWWRVNFDPSTGSWIYEHPELDRIENICVKQLGIKDLKD